MTAAITPGTWNNGRGWERDGRHFNVSGTLALSGSYPGTDGDAIDFSVFKMPQSLRGAAQPPILGSVTISGKAGFQYAYVPGTGRDNGKCRVNTNSAGGANGALAEHSTAAYAAGVSGDVITITAQIQA